MKMKKSSKHPGFKAVVADMTRKNGKSAKTNAAILASASRNASPKAKKANPRLKRVK